MGFFYYRRRMTRRTLLGVLSFSTLAAVLAVMIFATIQMRPILVSLATTRVSNMVNRIVSEAVDEAIDGGNITYSDLITFEKDSEGRIAAIYSNMRLSTGCNPTSWTSSLPGSTRCPPESFPSRWAA